MGNKVIWTPQHIFELVKAVDVLQATDPAMTVKEACGILAAEDKWKRYTPERLNEVARRKRRSFDFAR